MNARSLKSTIKRTIAAAALGVAAGLLPAGAALADYANAKDAYEQERYDYAIDLWKRYAIAGDVKSKRALGDIYSGKALEDVDKQLNPVESDEIKGSDIEALAWYNLAAHHDLKSYNQTPTTSDITSKYQAQERVAVLKQRMSDADVRLAERRVVEILSAESEFDLYRLGKMYQAGTGLPKNNIEALKYFELAKDRNTNNNLEARIAADYLENLMSAHDIGLAQELAANWEPPLPEALKGSTPRQQALELELAQLRAIQLAEAIKNIEKEFSDNEDLLQSALAALGYYQGAIDGKLGKETRTAVRNFQYSLYQNDHSMTEEERQNKRTGTLSPEQMVQLIQLAADREHPQSQYVYGIMYAQGIGVPKNGENAVYWLKKSANYGYALAHYALGNIFRQGLQAEDPVEANLADATYHLGQAYALGHEPAQKELIELHYERNPADNERGSQEK